MSPTEADELRASLAPADTAQPTPLEAELGITANDPSLEKLLAREEADHCEAFFLTTDPKEIQFMKDTVRDIHPAGQAWLRAFILDQYREQPARIAEMSLRTFIQIYCDHESEKDARYEIAMKDSLLVFLSTLGFESARTAVDLTPRVLIDELEYPPVYAFHVLARYATLPIQEAMQMHTRLVQVRIQDINERKAAA
jgi:hypothetical protein